MDHTRFLQVAEEAYEHLERLKDLYPHLVSSHVESAMNNWRQRISSGMDVRAVAADIKQAEDEALAKAASELMQTHQLEDVLQLLSESFSFEVDYARLLGLVDQRLYVDALRRDINELLRNSVSLEQAAQLWNSMGRPSLGGEQWSEESVSAIMR